MKLGLRFSGNGRSWMAFAALLLLLAGGRQAIAAAATEEAEVVLLPRITVEEKRETGGQEQSKETICTGVCALPYNVPCASSETFPPQGYAETQTAETIKVLGKDRESVRRRCTLDQQKGYSNHGVEEINVWTAPDCQAPEFLIPLGRSPDLRLPAGCLKFEVPKSGEKALSARGELIAQEEVLLHGAKHQVFRYSLETGSAKEQFRGQLAVSPTIPGTMYQMSGESTSSRGMRKGTIQVKDVATEPPPTGLCLRPAERFAFRPPADWTEVQVQGQREILRYAPKDKGRQGQFITLEVFDAKGQKAGEWATAFHDQNQAQYGLAFSLKGTLADSPTFCLDHWAASAKPVPARIIGTVRDGRVHLISWWLPQIAERADVESPELVELEQSWRWLRKKPAAGTTKETKEQPSAADKKAKAKP